MKIFKLKKQKGFTLLEVLFALSIIVIGALGVFALMNRTVYSTEQKRQSIVSVSLAREGIELIRSMRDSSTLGFSYLAPGDWILDAQSNYGINIGNAAVFSDPNNPVQTCNNCYIYLNNIDGTHTQYTHDNTGSLTNFKRLVNITDGTAAPCLADCKVVTVSVLAPGSRQPYVLQEYLTNWRP
jgi:prepilin-type N-terminal cleavage/methylation domain-containing protein